MTTDDLIARLRAGTVTPEICEAAAVALERARDDALEEAAREAETQGWQPGMLRPTRFSVSDEAAMDCAERIAENIRALKGTPE